MLWPPSKVPSFLQYFVWKFRSDHSPTIFLQLGLTKSSPTRRATFRRSWNRDDSTNLPGMFSEWKKSAIANSSRALWHLWISCWFLMAVAVDIDGWIDLVVKEVAEHSLLLMDTQSKHIKTPHRSNRDTTAEHWSFSALLFTDSWWHFLAPFASLPASCNAWYQTRYWGGITALQTWISHFYISNKCFRALVACTGLNVLSHLPHFYPTFPPTMHNSRLCQSKTLFRAGKGEGTGCTDSNIITSSLPMPTSWLGSAVRAEIMHG